MSVQSMCKTDTRDARATCEEVLGLWRAGCELVRVAIPDREALAAFGELRKRLREEGCPVPLCADIHFDYRLALGALEAGAEKLRINPGNIGGEDRVRLLAREALARGVPIRVGVNAGSLERDLLHRWGRTPEALVESARRQAAILEDAGFRDIVVSVKASDVPVMVRAYEVLARETDYPLHLGVTEAGPPPQGLVKSALGIGSLLLQGIGDTIRVSLTAPAREEVEAGYLILEAAGLRRRGVEIIACPTCGRIEVDLFRVVREVRERVSGLPLRRPLKVAVMGCAVNGPGEASEADLGVACGKGVALLFRRGRVVRKVTEEEMVEALIEEIREMGG